MQQDIDQLFKQGMESLGDTPPQVQRDPDAAWARVEGMLDHKPRRRTAWIWVSAAATIALLIALGWGFQPGAAPENDGITSVNSILPLKESIPNEIATADQPAAEKNQGFQTVQCQQGLYRNLEPDFRSAQSQTSPISYKGANAVVNATATGTYTISVSGGLGSTQACTYAWTPTAPNQFKTVYSDKLAKGLDANRAQQQDGDLWSFNKNGLFAVADSLVLNLPTDPYGAEGYAETVENPYFTALTDPLSTFSIDVDRASYTNHRRFVEQGQLPPKYSVRAEEFINYFSYDYPQPRGTVPFSIQNEVTTCPWNPRHKLARIALKGREVATDNLPPANIVFLLDVSGSMEDADKLPLLKQALGMLTEQLREQDKVSIVVYAGAAGLVLPPTSGNSKAVIMRALDNLQAGGSTAGGEGIELAYATAQQYYRKGGNNRVVLATDGDFNVGISDENGLERLITQKREQGVFLSVLGFGEGNLQDGKMELLADKGNGNYNYIDSEREAHKVLVSEFGGTMYTIAKDVKIQVEFNPALVSSYRLVGYENRKLRNEDFANDKIDAGDLGAGHTVTALYELVPATEADAAVKQPLKYQQAVVNPLASKELLTVKLRYKDPEGSVSKLLEQVLLDDGRNIAQTSNDFRWAVAVAEYALILRQSEYAGAASMDQVLALARSAVGRDEGGHRKEFIELAQKVAGLMQMAKYGGAIKGH